MERSREGFRSGSRVAHPIGTDGGCGLTEPWSFSIRRFLDLPTDSVLRLETRAPVDRHRGMPDFARAFYGLIWALAMCETAGMRWMKCGLMQSTERLQPGQRAVRLFRVAQLWFGGLAWCGARDDED